MSVSSGGSLLCHRKEPLFHILHSFVPGQKMRVECLCFTPSLLMKIDCSCSCWTMKGKETDTLDTFSWFPIFSDQYRSVFESVGSECFREDWTKILFLSSWTNFFCRWVHVDRHSWSWLSWIWSDWLQCDCWMLARNFISFSFRDMKIKDFSWWIQNLCSSHILKWWLQFPDLVCIF